MLCYPYKKYVDEKKTIAPKNSKENRYLLHVSFKNTRNTGKKSIAAIMKNPSYANKKTSDKSVNNILEVAYRAGYKEVYLLNLYSYRFTDIEDFKKYILKPELNLEKELEKNSKYIKDTMNKVEDVIVCWGTIQGNKSLLELYNKRVNAIYELIKTKNLYVIDEDFSDSKYPKHPQALAFHSSKVTLKEWEFNENN